MSSVLLLTLDYPPDHGGVAAYYSQLAAHWPGYMVVLAIDSRLRHGARGMEKVSGRNEKLKIKNEKMIEANKHHQLISPGHRSPVTGQPTIIHRRLLWTLLWPHWLPAIWHTWRLALRTDARWLIAGQLLPLGPVAWLVSRIMGTDYAVILHGLDVLNAAKHPRRRKLAQFALRRAKLIVVNSQMTQRLLQERFSVAPDKVIVLTPCPHKWPEMHDAAELRRRSEELRGQFGSGALKIALTAGRLVKRKGFDVAIEALAKLKQRHPELRLVIAGDGPERTRLEAQAQALGVAAAVTFTGAADDQTMAAWYAAADLLVLPGRDIPDDVEGFGIVLLEAAAFGKPAVAGRLGGMAEAVRDGETGLLCTPGDSNDLAKQVERLLAEPGLAERLGQQGKRWVEREFRWEERAERLAALLT